MSGPEYIRRMQKGIIDILHELYSRADLSTLPAQDVAMMIRDLATYDRRISTPPGVDRQEAARRSGFADFYAMMSVDRFPDMFVQSIPINFGFGGDGAAAAAPVVIPLSQDIFNSFTTMVFRPTMESLHQSMSCAICVDDFQEGETLVKIRCNHIFHQECARTLFNTTTRCPLCRRDQREE